MSARLIPFSPPERTAPSHLGESGRRFWRDVLRDYQFVDAAGLTLLQQAAECLDSIEACRRQIATEGMTVAGSRRGSLRPHPLLRQEAEYRRLFYSAVRGLNLDMSPED